jgi:AcrR family transcriptional regulator
MVVLMSRQPAIKLTPGPQGASRDSVAEDQRGRLLGAMAEVVAAVGYEEASVERVLVQAGVSRRTFYELFGDKEDCFVAAYDEAMRRVLRVVTEAYLECEAVERRIECALEAFLRLCAEEPALARMCVVEVFAAGPRARARRAEAMERLAALMERALSELRGDDELDRLTAQALIGGVHEVIYQPIDQGEVASLPGLAEEIVASQVAPLLQVGR